MVTRDQVQAMLNGEIDLGLARPPFDDETMDSRPLRQEALVVALPAGHRLLDLGRSLDGADLRNEPLIMHAPTRARYFLQYSPGAPGCTIVGRPACVAGNAVHELAAITSPPIRHKSRPVWR